MTHFSFSIVLSADLIVDVFFWMTAFLASYFMLGRLRENAGKFGGWKQIARIYLTRVFRLLPTYFFALLFFWKFLVLFGGEGPTFFMYTTMSQCSRFWFWHITFLNNLIPWASDDTCLDWTWYLANDFQFFLTVPLFVHLYFNHRRFFNLFLIGSFAVSKLI